MRLAIRIDGLGSRIGRALMRISDTARLHSVRRAQADGARISSVYQSEVSHAVSQSGAAGYDLRGTEH